MAVTSPLTNVQQQQQQQSDIYECDTDTEEEMDMETGIDWSGLKDWGFQWSDFISVCDKNITRSFIYQESASVSVPLERDVYESMPDHVRAHIQQKVGNILLKRSRCGITITSNNITDNNSTSNNIDINNNSSSSSSSDSDSDKGHKNRMHPYQREVDMKQNVERMSQAISFKLLTIYLFNVLAGKRKEATTAFIDFLNTLLNKK